MQNSEIDFNKAPNYINQLLEIWKNLKRKRRFQLIILLILMILSGIAEVFSIALVVPFLEVLSNPERLNSNPLVLYLSELVGIYNPEKLLLPITISFALAAIFAAIIKFVNSSLSFKLSALIGSDLSCSALKRILYLPYEQQIKRNSSESINAITTQLPLAVQFISNSLRIITSLIILFFIICTLTAINYKISFLSLFVFSFFYICSARIVKKKATKASILFEKSSKDHIKILQESIGAIREISLNRTHKTFLKIYRDIDYQMRNLISYKNILAYFPKYFVEAICLVIIAVIAFLLSIQKDDFLEIIPILGTLAFGAQKILPNFQEIYKCWVDQKAYSASLKAILEIVNQQIVDSRTNQNIIPLKFNKSISFDNVSFKYSDNAPYIIKKLSIEVFKGQRIGIVGSTGSGKSTLMDLIMGLIKPTSGLISIDGSELHNDEIEKLNSWRVSVSHVPQNIYLSDRSFKENIAFGIPIHEINFRKVVSAAKKANISDYIESTRFGYNTFIGERGLKLSGGQKQRIGIARALYRDSEILIFDEATSSLDNSTEIKVMESINNLGSNLTIIIIAHRLSTLASCDRIIEIENGLKKYDGPPEFFFDKV